MKRNTTFAFLFAGILLTLLVSCAPEATCAEDIAVQEQSGFWGGIIHGLVFPVAVIAKVFNIETGLYAVNNTGTWYWVGYFIGFGVLGGGMFRGSRRRK